MAKDGQDPGVTLRCGLIAEWLRLWLTSPQHHVQWSKAWYVLRRGLSRLSVKQRWRQVAGTISAVICTLLDLEWLPHSPHRWTDPEGCRWCIKVGSTDLGIIMHHFRVYEEARLWKQAQRHHLGTGLDEPPDFSMYRRHRRTLVAKGQFAEAACSDTIVAGASWTGLRRRDAGDICGIACPRCGCADESGQHRVWQCTDVGGDALLSDRGELAAQSVQGCISHPSLWLRGLPPQSWFGPPDAPDDVGQVVTVGSWVHESGRTGDDGRALTLFLDGSGLGDSYFARRCGWACACMLYDGSNDVVGDVVGFDGGECGTLPGPLQSVFRAELYAVLRALMHVGDKGHRPSGQ